MKEQKRGQVAIFVIIAIVLVVSIALVFVLIQKPFGLFQGQIDDPRQYIEDCLKEDLEDSIKQVSMHGGYVVPQDFILFNNTKVSYLCYTDEDEALCINNEPMLGARIKLEIKKDISDKVERCFEGLGDRLQDYEDEATDLSIDIESDKVVARIKKRIRYTDKGNQMSVETFNIPVESPMFDFVRLTLDVINQEVDCDCLKETCNADVLKMALMNRDFEVNRFVTGRNEEIYTIREVETGKNFRFAIRNCVRSIG